LVLAGLVLAEGAVRAGKNVIQTQSYGPEARGGASRAEVIISDGDIDYPKVVRPDLLLAMSQEAYDRYGPLAHASGALVLVDQEFVQDFSRERDRVVALLLTSAAAEKIGKALV